MTRAEDIRIESDEAGFELHVLVDDWPTMTESGWMIVNIHNVAPELFEQVKREIGSWLAEAEGARMLRPYECQFEDVDESAGLAYDTSDPKHPDYHSVHADHYDNREKGGRTF